MEFYWGHWMERVNLAIIILNWNGIADTLECLKSLSQCLVAFTFPYEIIVVDNNSQDESIPILQKQPGITALLNRENRGFAAGVNSGIKLAQEHGANFFVILNNDTILDTNFLMPLLEVFQKDPKAGIAAPKIKYYSPDNRLWFAGGAFRWPRIIGRMIGLDEVDQKKYDCIKTIDFATGCCMLFSDSLIQNIGLFDERFFFYQEDIDFSFRAGKAGFTIWYQPLSVIRHKVAQSTKNDIPLRLFYQGQSRMLFFRKHIHGIKYCLVLGFELIRLIRTAISCLGYQNRNALIQSYIKGLWSGYKEIIN